MKDSDTQKMSEKIEHVLKQVNELSLDVDFLRCGVMGALAKMLETLMRLEGKK
jgi:hypothetical protein